MSRGKCLYLGIFMRLTYKRFPLLHTEKSAGNPTKNTSLNKPTTVAYQSAQRAKAKFEHWLGRTHCTLFTRTISSLFQPPAARNPFEIQS